MNKITEDDLILLYYGEHDDPELGRRVAADPVLAARFRQLGQELEILDTTPVPEPDAEFGARVWQRLVPRLAAQEVRTHRTSWWQRLGEPRFSLAGVMALALVAALSFWLGRQAGTAPPLPGQPTTIDADRLLTGRVGEHLSETDLLLTQYANDPAGSQAEWAADLVLSNRIYRRAAEQAGHARLAQLLGEIEPLLIELANDSDRAQADNSLLFRIRTINEEISDEPI